MSCGCIPSAMSAPRHASTSHPRSHRSRRLWTAALAWVCRRRSVVLGYHGVAESRLREDLSLLQVSPERFRTHMELLLAAGFRFVTVAELARR